MPRAIDVRAVVALAALLLVPSAARSQEASSCMPCAEKYCIDPAAAAAAKARLKAEMAARGLPPRLLAIIDAAPDCVACVERASVGMTLVFEFDREAWERKHGGSPPASWQKWTRFNEALARDRMREGLLKRFHIVNSPIPCHCCPDNIDDRLPWSDKDHETQSREDANWDEDVEAVIGPDALTYDDPSQLGPDPADLTEIEPRFRAPGSIPLPEMTKPEPLRIVQAVCPECVSIAEERNKYARYLNEQQREISNTIERLLILDRAIANEARQIEAEEKLADQGQKAAETAKIHEAHQQDRARALRRLRELHAQRSLWEAKVAELMRRLQECEKTRCQAAANLGSVGGGLIGGAIGGNVGVLPAAGAAAVGGIFGSGPMMVSYDSTVTCTYGGGKVAAPTASTDGGKATAAPTPPPTDPKSGAPPPQTGKPGGPAIAPPDKGGPSVTKPPAAGAPSGGKPGGPAVAAPPKPSIVDAGPPTPKETPPPSQPMTPTSFKLVVKAALGKAGPGIGNALVKLAPPDPELPGARAKDAVTAHASSPVQGTTRADGTVQLRSDPLDDSDTPGKLIASDDEIEVDLTPHGGLIVHHGPGILKGLPGVKLGRTWTTGGKIQTALFAPTEDLKKVAADLAKVDGVKKVEINFCRVKEPSGKDPYYGSKGSWKQPHDDQWAIKRVGFGPEPGSPWTAGAAPKPVVVAVIDTGLDWDHLDIDRANLWTNEKEVPGNGKDDDGNGYVDDMIGWDFMEDDNRPWDRDGHGTFVAGVIAAAHNDVGISGIDPQARIMVLRALNDFGHTRASYLAEAITYAADNGARVVNLSVGGKEPTEAERLAVEYARSKGVLIVAAAGNDAEDVGGYGPAGLPGVLTIAATDFEDRRASFSNWGKRIDMAAPGLDVLSLRARATDLMRDIPGVEYVPGTAYVGADRRYYRASGTSFAAPIVAGAASLLWSRRPELTVDEVARVLVHSAKDVDTPGRDQYTGYGLLDVRAALARDPRSFVEAEISGVRVATVGGQTVVEVSGTADADRFRGARLEIGAGPSPRAWTPVGAPRASGTRESVLGAIPAATLAGAKEWTIRVLVEHVDGTRREARFNLKLQ